MYLDADTNSAPLHVHIYLYRSMASELLSEKKIDYTEFSHLKVFTSQFPNREKNFYSYLLDIKHQGGIT